MAENALGHTKKMAPNHRMQSLLALDSTCTGQYAAATDPRRSVRKNDLMRKVTRKEFEGLFLIRGVGGIGVLWQAAPFFW